MIHKKQNVGVVWIDLVICSEGRGKRNRSEGYGRNQIEGRMDNSQFPRGFSWRKNRSTTITGSGDRAARPIAIHTSAR